MFSHFYVVENKLVNDGDEATNGFNVTPNSQTGGRYWSSTESQGAADGAECIIFLMGPITNAKSGTYSVRAIRAF